MTTGMEVFLVADTYPIQFKFGIFYRNYLRNKFSNFKTNELMTFVENVETGQFLCLIVLILS
jgi:hypothetical protein